jgi:hypothetical protein
LEKDKILFGEVLKMEFKKFKELKGDNLQEINGGMMLIYHGVTTYLIYKDLKNCYDNGYYDTKKSYN